MHTSHPNPRMPSKHASARNPRSSNIIANSSLRPHVLARDRLALWMTPFAVNSHSHLSQMVSHSSTTKLREVALKALEPNTRKNYGAGLLRFNQFCDCHHVAEHHRMPASDNLIATFVAHWCGIVARSTIDTWLAGLAFWHALNGAPWPTGRLIRITCAAAIKLQPTPKPKRPPVTVGHLRALHKHLDLSNTFDTAVFATACMLFWGVRRLGELTVPSANGFNPERHVARKAKLRLRTTAKGINFYTLTLPWSKTTNVAGLDITFTDCDDITSPVLALTQHLLLNTHIPSIAPFMAYESTTSAGWAPLTRDWFLHRCNTIWRKTDMATLTGHSFRIGGATELLLRGTPPDIVAAQGSWKSRAFLEYWRKVDHILPLFISDSFTANRLSSLRKTMRSYNTLSS